MMEIMCAMMIPVEYSMLLRVVWLGWSVFGPRVKLGLGA